jgi:hypothetical protein
MARALAVRSLRVDAALAQAALEHWRRARVVLSRAGCHLWVFRSGNDPEHFVEFVEGGDIKSVCAARERASLENGGVELLVEVPL